MRGAVARWTVALRIARRGALISWGRSLLVVALIGVPIIGLSAAAVLLPSTQATLQERIQGTLGHAQALLTVEGSPGDRIRQGVDGGYDYASDGDSTDQRRLDPRTALPSGTRVLAIGGGAGVFSTRTGSTSVQAVTGPSWDPSLDGGPYALLSGRRPTAADEILLSPAALARLGAHVGGTVQLVQPEVRTLAVVGTARDRSAPADAQTVFTSTSVIPPDESAGPGAAFVYYVPDRPIDWATVERLNRVGTTVFSRAVVLDPPALPADQDFSRSSGPNFGIVLTVTIAVLFAVLEVALLAGAAFLVGARLQQRSLATIASVGADRAVLRRIVTANGVVLGAMGGVAGVALGIGGALLVMRLTDDGSWNRYPGVHLLWPLLAGIVLFGVLVGWLAALLPARSASRFDVVRALRGARTPQRVGKRPVAGVVLLAGGIVLTLLGTGALVAALKVSGGSALWPQLLAMGLLGGGPVIAQVGVVLCSGLVLRGVTRLLRRAPLPTRLAARDTSRNLGRVVPAVASVMTTVFVAAFAMCIANTASQQAATQYYWNATVPGEASSQVDWSTGDHPTDERGAAWLSTIRRTLPVASSALVRSTQMGTGDPKPSDRAKDASAIVRFPSAGPCSNVQRRDVHDLACGPFTPSGGAAVNAQPTVSVGDETALRLLLGRAPSAAALQAYRDGGAVALRSGLVRAGAAHLDWYTQKQLLNDYETERPVRTTAIAAVTDLPVNPNQTSLLVSPATAARLGLAAYPDRVLATFTRAPSDAELDAANAALGGVANQPYDHLIDIETGPQDLGSTIAWYVLLACLVIAIAAGATAIGLARVDGRPDDVTLSSLGASPRIRRSIASVQALIVCGLGAILGTLLGMLPAVALGGATDSLPFSPPLAQLVLMALGIPVVIAAGSWLLVGARRADLTRRTAIA